MANPSGNWMGFSGGVMPGGKPGTLMTSGSGMLVGAGASGNLLAPPKRKVQALKIMTTVIQSGSRYLSNFIITLRLENDDGPTSLSDLSEKYDQNPIEVLNIYD
jgi:hypothetical protein